MTDLQLVSTPPKLAKELTTKIDVKDENHDFFKPNEKGKKESFTNNKPYTILDYPFVIMNGKMYEIMSKEDIKEELRCHFLKKKRRKKRKQRNDYNYF